MTIEKGNLEIQNSYDELKDFLKAVQKRDDFDPHIHLIPDFPERRLGIYYHTGEAGSGEVMETILEDVSFKMDFSGREREVANWFLTYDEADNLISYLTNLKWERSETLISVRWREETGMPMMEDSGFGEEELELTYKTESSNRQKVHIKNVYRNEVHKLANFK